MKRRGYPKLFIKILLYKPWMFIISILLNIVIFSYWAVVTLCIREVLNFVASNSAGKGNALQVVIPYFLMIVAISLVRMGAITSCALMDRIQDFNYDNLLRTNIMRVIYKSNNIKNMAGKSEKAFEILDDDVPVCTFPSQLLSEVSGFVVFSCIAIASLLIINWKVTIYIFIPMSLAILIINIATKKLKGNRKANREAHSNVSEMISDTANLVQTIKVSRSEESILKHYEKLNKTRLSAVLKDTMFESGLQAVLGSTVYIGTAVMMLLVARKMTQGQFRIGDFSIFIAYLETLASCVERIVEIVSLRKQAEVSYDRIIELIGEENESELSAYVEQRPFKPIKEFECDTKERTPLKELQVQKLTYGYDDRGSIRDVSFSLKPGEILAVAGGVGSGKSTVLNALMGVIPKDSGKVLWNGKEIVDYKDFFAPPNAAYTPQIAKIFSDTLGENLLLGKKATEEKIREALYNAVFEEDVSGMEQGLETEAGSSGSMLSGGQRQRLALARMFLHEAELYVLDDSSSAIDPETEREFWSRFEKNISKSKFACIIATNKRQVLKRADKVIFMKDGEVADCGKAEELLARNAEFASIYVG